jgi:4-hydroxy-3-polyprenylbenzoate decarboxylase
MESVKIVLYVEHTVDPSKLAVALWRFCNNLDPKRDQFLYSMPSRAEKGKTYHCLGLDGTIKTKELDNFQRDWPNIIVAADETIESVDSKWKDLGLGEFIPSPSLSYKEQLYGEEAMVQ